MATIYHNPRCSKSRRTLELIKNQDIEPEVVLYLETPLDAQAIAGLLKKLGISARQLLRKGEQAYKEQNLADSSLTEKQLIDAMVNFPKLIERPIVVVGDRAVIGRPPEQVLEIL
jgi:arsenate reductase (glutaredoxin)